jgi:Tfp pilus assembly pilus retraction ATPase PilT
MQTLDQSLKSLLDQGLIEPATAFAKAVNPDSFG